MPSPSMSASRTPSRAVGRLFGLDASQPRHQAPPVDDDWDDDHDEDAFYESTRRRSDVSRSASRSRTPRRSLSRRRRSSTSAQSPNVLKEPHRAHSKTWRPPGAAHASQRTLPPAPARTEGRPLTFDVDALQKDHAIIVDQVIEQLTRGNALSVSSLTLAEPQKFGAVYDRLQAELERVLDSREDSTPADAARSRDVQHIVSILFSLVEHERSSFLFSMSSLRETVKRREGRLAARASSELSQGLQRRLNAGAALLTALTRVALEERPTRRAWSKWRLYTANSVSASRCAALETALRFAAGQSEEAALREQEAREKLLKRVASRWLNMEKHGIFDRWNEWRRERVYVRQLAKRVLGRMMHGKVASAIASWVKMVQLCKEEESEKKRQEVILQRVRAKWLLGSLSRVMNRWCEMVSERQHMRRLVKKVIGQLMNGLSGSAFRTWTSNVKAMKEQEEEAKRQAVIFERIRKRWLNQATGAAYRSWLEFVFERKRVRGLVKKVIGQLMHGLEGSAFRAWLANIEAMEAEAEEEQRMQRILDKVRRNWLMAGISSAFRRWDEYRGERRQLRKLATKTIQQMLNNRVLPAFSQWVKQVELFKRADYLMRKVIGQLLHGLTGSSFRSWCGAITQMKQEEHEAQLEKCRQLEAQLQERDQELQAIEQARIQSLMSRVALRLKNGGLLKVWARWEELVYDRKLMRKVVGQLLHGLTGSSFRTWSAFVEAAELAEKEAERHDAICAKFVKRMRLVSAAKALNSWRENAHERKRLRRLMRHVLARLMKGKLVPALSQWRAAATALRLEARERERQQKLLDRMRRRMLNKCAFSALLAWDHFVSERKRLRALALHVLNRLSRGKIVLALERWRAVLREEKQNELQHDRVQKLMRRVALRLKNAGFVKVWGAWEEFVWQRRTLRALTMRFVEGKVAAALFTWREERRCGIILERFGRRLRFACVSKALVTWIFFRRERKRVRALMTHILVTLKHALQHKAFGTWLAYEHEERRLENVGKRVLVMLTRGCLLRCFHALQAERDERRRLRELVTRAVRQMRQGKLGLSWRCWREAVVQGRLLGDVGARRLALMRVCRFVRHSLVVSFSTWRRGSTLLVSHAYEDYKQREEHWREKRALQMWTDNFQGRCFDTWRDVVRTEKRERVALYRHSLRVNRRVRLDVFVKWDRMRRDRRLARSVLSRMIHVAVDGTTRAAIDMWRDQAFDMRRHEAVLDRVRRKWLHQTATKSFERWREYVLVRKHVKTVALHVLQRLAHSNAAPAFVQWRDQTRRLNHCDHLVGSALARMRHACAARAFVGWVHRWEESKRRTDLLTHIVMKLLHAKLAPGFRKLVAYALDYDRRALARERTDRLLKRVVSVFEHTRLNEAINGWKRFTLLRREAEEKQVRQDVILDRCRRRLRHSLLGRSYNQWVFYKRDRKRLRTLARRIVKQFYNNETWPALNTWKAFMVRQRSLERLMHKVIGQLQHRLTSTSWRTWTTTIRKTIRYETIIDRSRRKWLHHAQAKALTAWCFMVSERQRLRNLVKKAFYRMRSSKLGRGFRTWARIVETGRTTLVRDAAASAKTAARYWFDAAELRSEHVLRRNAFGAFKQLRRRRAQNRLRAARWARALKRRRSRTIFDNWRRYGKLRMLQVPGKLRAALRVAHDECARQLRRGFSVWLHGVDVQRLEEARKAAQGASRLQRLDKALIAIEYTQYQLVRKVFVAWTDVFLHRKRSGRLTSFVGVALARATMIKAYHAWGRYVESHRRVRRTLKTLSTRKHATNCFRAFGRWHAYSASLPAVGAEFVAGFAVPPPPCDDSDEDVTLTPPPPPSGLFSSGPSYASTPTAAQPYFDDDPVAGAGTLYESPVGRAVEY